MRTVQYALSTDNPDAAAKFYNRLIDSVTEILSGFDRKNQRSKRNGGIFGHVKAFAGSTETQGTGNLHFHCLLWVHGVPPTVAEIDHILSDEEHGPKFTDQFNRLHNRSYGAFVAYLSGHNLCRVRCP